MNEERSTNPEIDNLHKRINAVKEDVKLRCIEADVRVRLLEDKSIRNDLLVSQFTEVQLKQTETNMKLNETLIKLDGSMKQIDRSLAKMNERIEKTITDVEKIKIETAVLPTLTEKIDNNEKLHQVDLRVIEKEINIEDVKKKRRQYIIIGGGLVGFLTVLGVLAKLLIDITVIFNNVAK